jgi:hypothetical protein
MRSTLTLQGRVAAPSRDFSCSKLFARNEQISSRFAAGHATCKHSQTQKSSARKIQFCTRFQRDLGRPVPARKIFALCRRANQIQNSRRPASARGALRTSSTWSAGCDGRGMSLDEGRCARTAKPCGPDAPTLASSRRGCSSIAPMTVARKPGHRGEHGGSR